MQGQNYGWRKSEGDTVKLLKLIKKWKMFDIQFLGISRFIQFTVKADKHGLYATVKSETQQLW